MLIFRHLDYFTLKRCMTVSKQFKAVTESRGLDGKMFRGQPLPAETIIDPRKINTHPLLASILVTCDRNLVVVTLGADDDLDFKALNEIPAADERATCPAVSLLYLTADDWKSPKIINPYGVTVQQVMHGFRSYYAHNRRCPCGTHSYRPYFEGIEYLSVNKKGQLHLNTDMSYDEL